MNFQCKGVLLIRIIVGQGPIAFAVGAGGGSLDISISGRRPDIFNGPLNPKK